MKFIRRVISNIIVLQGGISSCEAGIILAGRDFIKSAIQQDIFNLSGHTNGLGFQAQIEDLRLK